MSKEMWIPENGLRAYFFAAPGEIDATERTCCYFNFSRSGAFKTCRIFKRKCRVVVIGVEICPLPDEAVSRYDLLRLGCRCIRGVEQISQGKSFNKQEASMSKKEKPDIGFVYLLSNPALQGTV